MDTTELETIRRVRRMARNGTARLIREDAGISLRELASVLEASPSTLSRWERGESQPRTQGALTWARLLDRLRRQGGVT